MTTRTLTRAAQHVEDFHDATLTSEHEDSDREGLKDVAALRDALEEITHRRAFEAHRRGMTWQEVADALGIARQTASKLYRLSPESLRS